MSENTVSGVLRAANRVIRRKPRKSLSTLQSSTVEEVVKPSMGTKSTFTSKKKQPNAVNKVVEKENLPSVRRSKRKVAASDLLNYAESPESSKASKSLPKTVSAAKPKTKTVKPTKRPASSVKKADPNQTKLKIPPAVSEENKSDNIEPVFSDKTLTGASEKTLDASTSRITEDSGFDPISDEVFDKNSTPCSNNSNLQTVKYSTTEDDTSLITSATPTLNYWKELAEQRRIALENALRENEMMYDQLVVLEAENSQLKQLVREAEDLASIVKSIVE